MSKINNEILMAAHAGFCFGVKRAVDAIEDALKNSDSQVWTIGLPIHNPQEVSRLQSLGLHVADNESEIPSEAKVLIRAHGETLEVLEKLKSRNVNVIDMTCPFVSKAQEMAALFSEKGYKIILLGDKNHPEIKGIIGHVKNLVPDVIADENEAESLGMYNKVALISQTTQREEKLSKVAAVLVKKSKELHVCNTICKATSERQNAVKKLVEEGNVDGVVLVGGKSSANTGKLKDIVKSQGVSVLWIEESEELDQNLNWFNDKFKIGIAAGASTPAWLIINTKIKIAQIQSAKGDYSHGSAGSNAGSVNFN